MVSFIDIENALYAWATGVVGSTIPVIWYHQNAPRPNAPYVALHLFTQRSVGVDAQLAPGDQGENEIVGNRDFTLECQGVGKGSGDICELLKSSLQFLEVQEQLRAAGIAVVDWLAVQDLSELVDSRWEERNVVDFIFRFAQVSTATPGLIEHLNGEATYKSVDNVTITINTIQV